MDRIDNFDEAIPAERPMWENRELDEVTRGREKRGHFDLPFFILVLIILAIGVIMVLSASFARSYYTDGKPMYYFLRQLIFAASGVAITVAVSRFKTITFRKYALLFLLASIGLLVLVLIIGERIKGAKRWINLGFTTFQPSELAKLAIVLAYAHLICVFKKKMGTFKYGVLPFMVIAAVIIGLLMLEPHLSASVIIIALTAIMMFAGGTKLRWFAVAIIAVAAIAFFVVSSGAFEYAETRLTSWRNPEADPRGAGFQTLQSLYAIGSGGLLGQGLGQGRQKYLYLPEEHNDYIFSVVCEELGFIGAVLILMLFALLIIRGFWLALHAKDRFGSLVITGITSLLAIQVFLNVAVVTNLMPSTGISLPFFSYGGTALWIQLVEMGIVLAVSREIPLMKAG